MSKYRWNGDAARTRPWRPFQAVQGTAGEGSASALGYAFIGALSDETPGWGAAARGLQERRSRLQRPPVTLLVALAAAGAFVAVGALLLLWQAGVREAPEPREPA